MTGYELDTQVPVEMGEGHTDASKAYLLDSFLQPTLISVLSVHFYAFSFWSFIVYFTT